jgi:6-phosphogluconolactonase
MSTLQTLPSKEELGQAVASLVARLSAQAINDRARFTVALSGGSLPKIVCPSLVSEPWRSQIDWSAWHVFWADERCVPLDHPDSNFRLARQYLFNQVEIPVAQIYPIDDSFEPDITAKAYEAVLKQLFRPAPGRPPRFDIILLGMGEDGHTASLFPGHPLIDETSRWVAPVFDSPKPPPERITLTLPVINQARHVVFVTAGSSKANILARVLASDDLAESLPAQLVRPTEGELFWFVDEAAAAELNHKKTGES